MASITKKMVCNNISKGMHELANILKREIDAELVYESWRKFDCTTVLLISFERFYFRNGSYASLTIMLVENEHTQTADIIGSGGGEGIFNIGLGANSSFANMAVKILQKYGYIETE